MYIFRYLGRSKESIQLHFVTYCFFYGEEMLAIRPTPKLVGHPLSAVRNCLFIIFTVTLHICRSSFPSATRWIAMSWWHGSI